MEFRKSQWTESISSLLRKTELNLIRIQTPYHEEYPRSFGSVNYHASFYDNGTGETNQRPPTDFKEDTMPIIQQEIHSVKSSLEKLLNERLRSQKKDIEDIGDRLATLEIRNQDLDRFKEETRISLNTIEKRCLSEIRRIENAGKGFVTKEDLSIASEAITRANLNTFKHLEQEIQAIKGGDFDVKEEMFRMTEEKIRTASKKFVSVEEFSSFKESVEKDYEEKTKELEESISHRLEKFRTSYEREGSGYEQKIREAKKDFDQKESQIVKKVEELEGFIQKNEKRHKEEKGKVQEEIEKIHNLIDTTELEYRLDALEQGLKKLPKETPQPDLSGLVHKQDLASLQVKLVELETYKRNLDNRIFEVEKRVMELENQDSESSEIDVDLGVNNKKEFSGKGLTFGKVEEEKQTAGFTNINIENLGESDSDSQYISPHTSPMNQLNMLKKSSDFEFKSKNEGMKKKTELNVVDEDPDIENKDHSYSKSPKPEVKKTEVKHFPVEMVKVESKKSLEEVKPGIRGSGEVKGVSLFIPEPAKILKSEEDSDSESSDSSFGLGLGSKSKKVVKPLAKPAELKVEKVDQDFGFEFGSSKVEVRDNRLKPVQKVIQIDDDDDDFGLFSKPEPKSIAKPVGKPAALNPKVPEKKGVSQEAEEEKWSFECYERFVKEEIDFCVMSLKDPQSRQVGISKIPSSIKGMSMQKLMVKESSSSNSGSGSGSESGSEDSSGSVNFDYNLDMLP